MSNSKKNKVVYFLGAGFSRSANFPLQTELLEHVNNLKLNSFMSEDFGLLQAFDQFSQYHNKIRKFLKVTFPDNNSPSLEDVFTLLDHSISEKTFCRGVSWEKLLRIDEALKKTILYAIYAASTKVTKNADALYKNIAAHFLDMRLRTDSVSVISVNWDSLLEDSLFYWATKLREEIKIDIDYCCYTMPILGSPHIPSIIQRASKINNFKMLKLHGSTNWMICPSCKKIFTGIGSKKNVFEMYFSEHKCALCYDKISHQEAPILSPFIITPTYLKAFPNPHIQNVWLNAYTELFEADKIVFMGYSLPDADFYVRSLLKRAIRPVTEIEVILWHTDDPRSGHEDLAHLFAKTRYENFFGKQIVKMSFNGVEEYFDRKIFKRLSKSEETLLKFCKNV